MKRSVYSPLKASIICSSRWVPRVATARAWVSPRVKRAEPWVRGSTPVWMLMGRTVRVSRPSIRGWPARIWLRTTLASKCLKMPLIWLAARVSVSSVISAASTAAQASSSLAVRACFWRILKASATVCPAISCTLATRAASVSGAFQSHTSGLTASASSLMARITACISLWPYTTAPSITSSGRIWASDSTISTACAVPATTKSSCDLASWVLVGFSTYSPFR